MKKEREGERFSAKQAERQRMIDRQIDELRSRKDNQEQVLNKQVAEAEDRANRLFAEQERRKFEMAQAIEKSRQLQIQRKQREKHAAKQEDEEFSQFWKVRNEELALAEEAEKEEEKGRQVEIAGFLKKQTNLKNEKAVKAFMNDHEAALKAQAMAD